MSKPSVVTINTHTKKMHTVGEKAQRMIGRTPASISAIQPLRHSMITDFETTKTMLRHFIGHVHKSRFAHPRLVMCTPSNITDVEQRTLKKTYLSTNTHSITLIEKPITTTINTKLPITNPIANIIININNSTNKITMISLKKIVMSHSLHLNSYNFNKSITGYIHHHHRLAINKTTSKTVKLKVSGVQPDESKTTFQIQKRNPASGLPHEAQITSAKMRNALEPLIAKIIGSMKDALKNTPPELAADLTQRNILLASNGALLRNFAKQLQFKTHMPIKIADDPLTCVVLNTGHALKKIDVLKQTAL